jgi:signal transduction histidine kinase
MIRTPERSPLVPLVSMRPDHARRLLSPPWVPTMLATSLARACRARALGVPVRLVLPHAALGHRFARALHGLTGGHGSLLAATDDHPELRGLPLDAAVVVDPTRLDAEASLALDALCDDGDTWLIAVTDRDAELAPALAARLTAIVVDVPPLARRQLELPALSAAILHTVAQRAGRPTPVLTAAARTRLASHTWPGDVFELEAVLGHALAASEGQVVDVRDLGLETEATPLPELEASEAVGVKPAERPTTPAITAGRLEALLAEMSHEILNPLATLKMLLGHLPQLLDDAEAREATAGRADEAIQRVDDLLQNVLAFARLGTGTREPVEVGPLLDRLLREAAPELAERSVRVRRTGDDHVTCVGDPVQLEYGFRNLLAGVAREVPPREECVVETRQNGVMTMQFVTGDGASSRLRTMLAADGPPDLGDPTILPLAFTLARAVLEQNGGSLEVRQEAGGPTTLVVTLPVTTVE